MDAEAKEIVDYVQEQDFNIFYADHENEDERVYFRWDKTKDWKDFFTIAKKEGITTLIATIRLLDKDELEQLENDLLSESENPKEFDNPQDFEKAKGFIKDLSAQKGKIISYNFTWIKDGLEYSISDTASWFEELEEKIRQEMPSLLDEPSGVRMPSSLESERLNPAYLKNKKEDDLVKELVQFVVEESKGNPSIDDFRQFRFMFWNKKGVEAFRVSAENRYIIEKVEMKAEQEIESMQLEREKKEMPTLIEECFKWCRETGLNKLNKTNISAFLTLKGIRLSKNSQDVLYHNIKLKL